MKLSARDFPWNFMAINTYNNIWRAHDVLNLAGITRAEMAAINDVGAVCVCVFWCVHATNEIKQYINCSRNGEWATVECTTQSSPQVLNHLTRTPDTAPTDVCNLWFSTPSPTCQNDGNFRQTKRANIFLLFLLLSANRISTRTNDDAFYMDGILFFLLISGTKTLDIDGCKGEWGNCKQPVQTKRFFTRINYI